MAKKPVEKIGAKNFDELKELFTKKYGEGSIMSMNDGPISNVYSIPTKIATIDSALGVFGIPEGRIIELYGAESSGKTTTCLHFIAAFQQHYFEHKGRNGKVAFIDAEHALDPKWAKDLGVNIQDLFISQPDSGDEALTMTEDLIDTGLVDLIIIDSVAALVTKEELEGIMTDANIGAQARLMSKALRKFVAKASVSKTTVIFINQVREKIGVMFGNNETTPGGRALRFYSSIRMSISKGSPIKDGDKVVGFEPKIKIVKNKVAPPFKEAIYRICFGIGGMPKGIDKSMSLIKEAAACKIVTMKGSSYSYGELFLGNGANNAARKLDSNKELFDKLYDEVKDRLIKMPAEIPIDPVDDDTFDEDDSE